MPLKSVQSGGPNPQSVIPENVTSIERSPQHEGMQHEGIGVGVGVGVGVGSSQQHAIYCVPSSANIFLERLSCVMMERFIEAIIF